MSFTPPLHSTTDSFLKWSEDPFGAILGTGYDRFESTTGICGVAKIKNNDLRVLVAHTYTPGQGQFRDFVRICKANFDYVCFEHILSDALPDILARYGFTLGILVEDDGTEMKVWKWEKNSESCST